MELNSELDFLEEKYGQNSWEYYPPNKQQVAQWLKDYTDKQLRLYGVSNRLSPIETQNVLRKPKLVQISTDLKNILIEHNNYHYTSKEDKEFFDKYSGKKAIVYEWCGDWWIAEDDNYAITEKCFEDLPNGY